MKLALGVGALAVGAAVVAVLLFNRADESLQPAAEVIPNTTTAPAQTPAPRAPNATIGSQWDWSELEAVTQSDQTNTGSKPKTAASFDVPTIYATLADIHLSESGEVIPDQTALNALNRAFVTSGIDWTPARVEELQAIVRAGLPGIAGEQAAAIVGDFYQYTQDKAALESVYTSTTDPAEAHLQYSELMAIRRQTMGDAVADQLFADEEASARYMFESIALAQDNSLSAAERRERQQALEQSLRERPPSIPQWQDRYAEFQQAKQSIQQAGLERAEAQRQLDNLVDQHFSSSEQTQASHFKLNRLEP